MAADSPNPLRLALAAPPEAAARLPELAGRLRAAAAPAPLETRIAAPRGPAELASLLTWVAEAGRGGALWVEGAQLLRALPPPTEPAPGPRILVRLTGAEAYAAETIRAVDWMRVERLLLPGGPDMERALREVRPGIEDLVAIAPLPPGLAPPPAPCVARVPFRLGWWGPVAAERNPLLALEVLHRLRREEPRWHLRIAGDQGERPAVEALLHLARRLGLDQAIGFDGGLDGPAARAAWHGRNLALLGTGLQDGAAEIVAEAALAGCDLAVLDHPGAEEILPAPTRFALAEEAAERLRFAAPDRWRDWFLARFPAGAEAGAILALLRDPPARPRAAAIPRDPVAAYWDHRYLRGGNSGAGSFGRLARFKAEIVNGIVAEHGVASVLELGCGDGHQLTLADYPAYVGVDVAAAAIAACRRRFAGDPTKRFLLAGMGDPGPADLVLSLDVIFHLVEDAAYEDYMRALFGHARRLVAIYASDADARTAAPHVRHRRFSAWIARNAPGWERIRHIPNRYPFDPRQPDETSFADFHLYARRAGAERAEAA